MNDNTLEYFGSSTIAAISAVIGSLFGPGVHTTVLDPITWADLGVSATVISTLLVVHTIAAYWIRGRARRSTTETTWRRDLLIALSRPAFLLIWVFGIYVAVLPPAARMVADDSTTILLMAWRKCLDVGVVMVLFWLFWRCTKVLEHRVELWAGGSGSTLTGVLVPLLARTLRVVVPAMAVILALPVVGMPSEYGEVVRKVSSLAIIGIVSWVMVQVVAACEKYFLTRYDITVKDNLEARKIHTQVHVITKTLHVVIALFAVASGLMLFEEMRRFGTSILASAGVVGIIVGFAAQRTIANLFAGFQLALTQPIRLDDVVIVENEWGRVEVITLTYVVVRIWDDRRLVVPLSYFIEKPFQNWTRASAQLMGSVFIWTDYTVPVAELREAVKEIVQSCEEWDGRFWNLQVTDSTDRAVQLRVLATSADSGKGWNLRCQIREKLIDYIQKNHPQSLPRFRAVFGAGDGPGVAVGPQAIANPGGIQAESPAGGAPTPVA